MSERKLFIIMLVWLSIALAALVVAAIIKGPIAAALIGFVSCLAIFWLTWYGR